MAPRISFQRFIVSNRMERITKVRRSALLRRNPARSVYAACVPVDIHLGPMWCRRCPRPLTPSSERQVRVLHGQGHRLGEQTPAAATSGVWSVTGGKTHRLEQQSSTCQITGLRTTCSRRSDLPDMKASLRLTA